MDQQVAFSCVATQYPRPISQLLNLRRTRRSNAAAVLTSVMMGAIHRLPAPLNQYPINRLKLPLTDWLRADFEDCGDTYYQQSKVVAKFVGEREFPLLGSLIVLFVLRELYLPFVEAFFSLFVSVRVTTSVPTRQFWPIAVTQNRFMVCHMVPPWLCL